MGTDIDELRAFLIRLGRAEWPVRRAVLEAMSTEDVARLISDTVMKWNRLEFKWDETQLVIRPLGQAIKMLERRGDRARAIQCTLHLIGFLETVEARSRQFLLSRIEELGEQLGPESRPIVKSLLDHPMRTVRAMGFRIAAKHRLHGFEEALRLEWPRPARWVAAYSVELLGPLELQALAWEIWQLSNPRIRVRLLRRGVRVPLEWIDALRESSPTHWLVLRCELGDVPDHEEVRTIMAAVTSEPALQEVCESLARAGCVEFLFELEDANRQAWFKLSRYWAILNPEQAPKLPTPDNLSPWEDP